MTEPEWNACGRPEAMLAFLGEQGASERKFRLFACGCVRRAWELLVDDRSRVAVQVAEQFAEGSVSDDRLFAVRTRAQAVTEALLRQARTYSSREEAAHSFAAYAAQSVVTSEADEIHAENAAGGAAGSVGYAQIPTDVWGTEVGDDAFRDAVIEEESVQCDLIRCMFAPFSQSAIQTDVLTPTVLAVARTIYDERAWDRLAILADALEEQGSTDQMLLGHLRGPGPHSRGCWGLDLVLGRE